MKKFEVEILETLAYSETVEAENKEDAIEKVRTLYRNGDIELSESDYVDTEFLATEVG